MKFNKILFDVPKECLSKKNILEKIIKFIEKPAGCLHIVSLNPEIAIIAEEFPYFKRAISEAPIKIIDGFGIVMARKILGLGGGERVPGVDLMEDLIKIASKMSLRVMLIGGKPGLADKLSNCYQKQHPQAKFVGIEGVTNIKEESGKRLKREEKKIFEIVSDFKPQIVFVAFGSPYQEIWLYRNRKKFDKMVAMGVGGAFDFLAGEVPRAPRFMRKLGLEWLFRLITQPWRWRRQLRLIKFLCQVIKLKLNL
ncbi:MAG: WecB/TagA/CpsF family glycosyltransferase [Patescibacteria group bacterium]|nr:WecB/TagA/CpsF family glycosyltransferase [Patescibacteria group bacterium]